MKISDIKPEQVNPHLQHPEQYGLDPKAVKKLLGEDCPNCPKRDELGNIITPKGQVQE